MLLPAKEKLARRLCLPLHRGPHPKYSDLVHQRLSMISRSVNGLGGLEIQDRLRLTQRALRLTLASHAHNPGRSMLNRRDPFNTDTDFTHLDAAIDTLWPATGDNAIISGV